MNDLRIEKALEHLIIEQKIRAGVSWRPKGWINANVHIRVNLNGLHLLRARLVVHGVRSVPVEYFVGDDLLPSSLEREINDLVSQRHLFMYNSEGFNSNKVSICSTDIPAEILSELEEHFFQCDPVTWARAEEFLMDFNEIY